MKNQIIEQVSSELKRSQEFVNNSFPSVYTKQDVIHLLDEFADTITTFVFENVEEKKSSNRISPELLEKLQSELIEAINSKIERLDSNELVDFDSASFEISYNNQVELESIDSSIENITNEVESAVEEILHDFFAPDEDEDEVDEDHLSSTMYGVDNKQGI
jgi:hypothetical protein